MNEVLNKLKIKKRKGTITITKNGVDFWGFNEGSGTPTKNEEEVKEQVDFLVKKYQEKYNLEIKDERNKETETIKVKSPKVEEEIQKAEEQAEIEFEKTLKRIEQDKTTNIIEEYYYIPKQFAKMVANGNSKGLILYGECGCGKSYNVMRAFRESEKEFVYLSGHITNLELYHFLFKNRSKNIILDDINILDNEINLNMLKSCLNDNSGIVSYNSSSAKLRVPNKFIFEGTICLLLNKKPRDNASLKAVESRVLNYELKLSYKDKIKIIFELAKTDYKTISQEKRMEIVKWIKDNTNEATNNFNLRVLFHLYEMFLFDNKNWKKLGEKILVKNEELNWIIQGLHYNEWCSKTGKSVKTYYRYKDRLKCVK